jgi:hypothetical protein
MKAFVKNLIVFFAVVFAIAVSSFGVLYYLANRSLTEFGTDTPAHSIFVGDSHIVNAIDESTLQGCVNIGKRAEPNYFSYYRLRKVLESNDAIKNVYLGFSYHSVASYYDRFIVGENSPEISSQYFLIMPNEEKVNLIMKNKDNLFSYLQLVWRYGFQDLAAGRPSFKKAKRLLKKNSAFASMKGTFASKKVMLQRITNLFYNGQELCGFSEDNITYLNKIIALCDEHGVALSLINTPLHPYYRSQVPEKFVMKYNEVVNASKVRVLDLNGFFTSDKYFKPDGDHMNGAGAVLFSEYLNTILNQNQLVENL